MCLLRLLRLPVLNAVCVPPVGGRAGVEQAMAALRGVAGSGRLMLRSDGGVERTSYYRGGNSFLVPDIPGEAAKLLALGRSVIVMEPTNRFTNKLTALLRLDRHRYGPGTLTIEALGPGYDVADLTRGGVVPQVSAVIRGVDWRRFELPRWSDISVASTLDARAEGDRLRERLENVARHLKSVGHLDPALPGDAVAEAESWLRAADYVELFDGGNPTADVVRNLREWFEGAFLVGLMHANKGWQCLALPYSEMANRKPVYWDVIDGEHKYATGR